MKRRNVKEQAEQGMKLIGDTNANLNLEELLQLGDISKNNGKSGIYDAVYTAFLMGVAVGNRHAKTAKKKARA